MLKPRRFNFTKTNTTPTNPKHFAFVPSQTHHPQFPQQQHRKQQQLLRKHSRSLLHKNPTNLTLTQQVHSHLLTTDSLYRSTVFSNTLLNCYTLSDHPQNAFFLRQQLLQIYTHSHFPKPPYFDSFTYSFLIKTCVSLGYRNLGRQLHAVITKVGFGSHVYVNTALVNMYLSLGCSVASTKVFDEMPERNSVTWNVMITGLLKSGELESARSFFEKMPCRNVVSWTGIIDGYTRMNRCDEALALFRRMVARDFLEPSEITVLAILPAVWQSGNAKICRLFHGYAEKRGFTALDIRVSNCLIDTYAKCGCIWSALRFFQEISIERRNLVSWTSIISGFAMHGMGIKAVDYLERMERVGMKPNRVTYVSVLSACSHGGLIKEGFEFFDKMAREGQVTPDVKHYGCLVDMLGRAGRLEEAEKIALGVPSEITNDVIWRTLLGACSFQNNVEMAERAMQKIMEMERGCAGDYVLMSNMLAGVGRFRDAERLRKEMDKRNALKVPGHSLV